MDETVHGVGKIIHMSGGTVYIGGKIIHMRGGTIYIGGKTIHMGGGTIYMGDGTDGIRGEVIRMRGEIVPDLNLIVSGREPGGELIRIIVIRESK